MNTPTGRGRGHRRRPMAEINVVPYIDVTLVLLIIFMVTAPLLQTGVDVELPEAEAKTVDPNQDLPILVSVDAEGRLFLDIGNRGDVEVEEARLAERIAQALAEKPGIPVLIRGDRRVDYGRIVTVMAMLKNAGVPSVGLMTGPAPE